MLVWALMLQITLYWGRLKDGAADFVGDGSNFCDEVEDEFDTVQW